ncbi:PEBP-like protein [Amniculicola lignicola CBS 123094]|uniref:PEBP-like protein n=1 Tax=Amniculicola lignicola CBS 123094 TaxID=1392246 RepID=A0A6A5WF51_9PLEO|nr:PEBP-like protein [Amniculicola lignicola CBS 123094]
MVTKPGTFVSRSDAKPAPNISISHDIVIANGTANYFLMSIDLDAPYPSLPFLSPILHGMQAGLKAEGQPDAEGYIKFTSSGKDISAWIPPNPPPLSAEHRYVFLVWEQPDDLTNDKIKERLGIADVMVRTSRMRWDQEGCEKKLGLGLILGGAYFLTN